MTFSERILVQPFRMKPPSRRLSGSLSPLNRRGARIPHSFTKPAGRRDSQGETELEGFAVHLERRP